MAAFFNTPALNADLYEYLLIAAPQPQVYAELMQEKQYFSNFYSQQSAVKTKPHITIASYLAKEQMEDTLIRYFGRIISTHKKFAVQLNNYSGFPTSHTIYARVQNHEPFKQLTASFKPVKQYIESCGFTQVFISGHPHLTIAKRLSHALYNKALMDYSRKVYSNRFEVSELVLLKRKHQYDTCRQVSIFGLA